MKHSFLSATAIALGGMMLASQALAAPALPDFSSMSTLPMGSAFPSMSTQFPQFPDLFPSLPGSGSSSSAASSNSSQDPAQPATSPWLGDVQLPTGAPFDKINQILQNLPSTTLPSLPTGPDAGAPIVSLVSPSANATLQGIVTFSAVASDPNGVTGVQFLVDNVAVGSELTALPYQYAWNSASVANGPHTVSVTAHDASGNMSTQSTSVTVANVSSSSSSSSSTPTTPPTGDSLILNPSLETDGGNGLPLNWHTGGFGINDAAFFYPDEGINGGKGARISMTTYTDGDAKWYFDEVAVTPGQEYAFSNSYKSTVVTNVTVRYTLTDGSFVYATLGSPAASNEWAQFATTLTVPANVASLTIFHALQAVGTLKVDNYLLRATSGGTPTAGANFDKGYVTLTFDDGWMSHYNNVRPLLAQYGMKGTFYFISDEVKNAPLVQNDPNDYMGKNQMLDIQAAGHEIGAHSKTHDHLTQLTAAQAQDEIVGSKNDLLALGVTSVNTFAYPFGELNDSVKNIVKNGGFVGARGVEDGYNTKASDKYNLKVQNVLNTTTSAQMKQWIDAAVANHTWLTLVIHNVDHTNDAYGTTPETLQDVLAYLKNSDIPVITEHQGLLMIP